MSGIEQELGPKGFAVVAGTLNDDPNIPDFIQRFHPNFPVGEANKLDAIQYMQFPPAQRLPFVPYMVFIDRQGVIRAQYVGSDKILDETQSDKLLREEALKFLNETTAPAKRNKKKKPTS
ncbi:MAG TPA: hypothetical protein VEU96_20860 [Bryobacteraceae bacterium]|nr:hypothetical protein [Bryobacteraceae bacterium]